MFGWIKDWMAEQKKGDYSTPFLPTLTKSAPMPEVKPPKEEQKDEISEPVQSIIRSLEEGWWSYTIDQYYDFVSYTPLVFKHEWFGTELKVNCYKLNREGWSVSGEHWMTTVESLAVRDACWDAYNALNEQQSRRYNQVKRESFMNLVNFNVV